MKTLFALFAILICSFTVLAQVPQAFNYQGIARDASGTPLANQDIHLRISIYQGASPGSLVYQERHLITTSKLGVFSIEIGNGSNPIGQLSGIDWGADEHYIQTEMDPDGNSNFQLMGESNLLSVPYALHAGNAVWKQSGSEIYYDEGFVGIGTQNPQQKLTIQGDDNAGPDVDYLFLNNTSLGNRSGVLMQLSAGDQSSITTIGHHSETYDYDGATFRDFGQVHSTGAGLILRASHNNGVIKFMNGTNEFNTSVERMRLSNDGNFGIGTANPASRLQVADGDIYIEDINNGVIMKSPDGNCWRMTINNDGSVKTTSITCPN